MRDEKSSQPSIQFLSWIILWIQGNAQFRKKTGAKNANFQALQFIFVVVHVFHFLWIDFFFFQMFIYTKTHK